MGKASLLNCLMLSDTDPRLDGHRFDQILMFWRLRAPKFLTKIASGL